MLKLPNVEELEIYEEDNFSEKNEKDELEFNGSENDIEPLNPNKIKIHSLTDEELEEIKKNAYNTGFNEGKDEGYKNGVNITNNEVMKNYNNAINNFNQFIENKDRIESEMKNEIEQVIFNIFKAILPQTSHKLKLNEIIESIQSIVDLTGMNALKIKCPQNMYKKLSDTFYNKINVEVHNNEDVIVLWDKGSANINIDKHINDVVRLLNI